MRQPLVAGIDGGQTSTTAAVALADGTIVGRGTGPPADLVGEPRGALERQRAALATALSAAFRDANLTPSTPLASLVAGVTGHDDGTPAPFVLSNAKVERFVHDTAIAHAGALGGSAGIVVLAGTGSVALGNAAHDGSQGPYVRAGGWGYFFGDEGGALWIARTAIAMAMLQRDRGNDSALGRAALSFFGVPDLRAIQHAFAHGELTRPGLAAFAAPALALAEAGATIETGARQLRDMAAAALCELVASVDGRLPPEETRCVSYAGGVFTNDGLRETFVTLLRARVPAAVVALPAADPLAGAVLLATQLARGAVLAPEGRT
jgi:glucosamine kinase